MKEIDTGDRRHSLDRCLNRCLVIPDTCIGYTVYRPSEEISVTTGHRVFKGGSPSIGESGSSRTEGV